MAYQIKSKDQAPFKTLKTLCASTYTEQIEANTSIDSRDNRAKRKPKG